MPSNNRTNPDVQAVPLEDLPPYSRETPKDERPPAYHPDVITTSRPQTQETQSQTQAQSQPSRSRIPFYKKKWPYIVALVIFGIVGSATYASIRRQREQDVEVSNRRNGGSSGDDNGNTSKTARPTHVPQNITGFTTAECGPGVFAIYVLDTWEVYFDGILRNETWGGKERWERFRFSSLLNEEKIGPKNERNMEVTSVCFEDLDGVAIHSFFQTANGTMFQEVIHIRYDSQSRRNAANPVVEHEIVPRITQPDYITSLASVYIPSGDWQGIHLLYLNRTADLERPGASFRHLVTTARGTSWLRFIPPPLGELAWDHLTKFAVTAVDFGEDGWGIRFIFVDVNGYMKLADWKGWNTTTLSTLISEKNDPSLRIPRHIDSISIAAPSSSKNDNTTHLFYLTNYSILPGPQIASTMPSSAFFNTTTNESTLLLSHAPFNATHPRPGAGTSTSFLSASERIGEDGERDGGMRLWFVDKSDGRIERWSWNGTWIEDG